MTVVPEHIPVMSAEMNAHLPPNAQVVLDLTLGLGGHAAEILQKTPLRQYIGVDRDAEAIRIAKGKLAVFGARVKCIHKDFVSALEELVQQGISADYVIADLGVSSLQLESQRRGFSFRADAPLDMRMNTKQERTAADILAASDESEIARILAIFGEERFARSIARNICQAQQHEPITTTRALVSVVLASIPKKFHGRRIHPATKTFQALRIAVNEELEQLRCALPLILEVLQPGGRMALISFHSLEDRLVKQFFRKNERACVCPALFPQCLCAGRQKLKSVCKKPLFPASNEQRLNPRSRSARLRIAQKL